MSYLFVQTLWIFREKKIQFYNIYKVTRLHIIFSTDFPPKWTSIIFLHCPFNNVITFCPKPLNMAKWYYFVIYMQYRRIFSPDFTPKWIYVNLLHWPFNNVITFFQSLWIWRKYIILWVICSTEKYFRQISCQS